MMWQVSHLATGGLIPITTWHATEDDALAEASRLRFNGLKDVVAWFCAGMVEA